MSDAPSNFIRDIIDADLRSGKHTAIATRFPPEPNGYLHIGHVKSVCLNFGLARDYEGRCHLRFDDTDPTKEDVEYAEAIKRDIQWLGFDWGEHLYYASDYFDRLYDLAKKLMTDGVAYVCDLSDEEVREYRGTISEAGRPSPYRDRSPEENLALFERMRAGEFDEGACTVRAKIDMSSPNMKMRDPLMYRIRKIPHWRQGDKWVIYPLYDWTHGLSDSFEGITHSICTLEFENNRELYDWFIEATEVPCVPRQYEFARLALNYTMMSKRKLLQLVNEGHVDGWDDPRMPTISGLRRRGVPAQALRAFAERVGVARNNSVVDVALLEHTIRDSLNALAPRVMCVLKPLEVVIENYPEGETELLEAPSFPPDIGKPGSRPVPFSRRLYIESDDFAERPPPRWHRLSIGGEVRLRHGYFIQCHSVKRDAGGRICQLRCTYDPETRGGKAPDGRKVKGTVHWVSADHALEAEVRLYDRLFSAERPGADGVDFLEQINPDSLLRLSSARVEPSVGGAEPGARFQFTRQGYFAVDPIEGGLRFNRIVTLKDAWARSQGGGAESKRRAPKKGSAPAERTVSDTPEQIVRADPALQALFDAALAVHPDARTVANFIATEVRRELKERESLPVDGGAIGRLVALVADGTISSSASKEVFGDMLLTGDEPDVVVERKGLRQLSDAGALGAVVDGVIQAHPDEVGRYRDGNRNLIGFFVGAVMRASRGKADPKLTNQLLRERLDR